VNTIKDFCYAATVIDYCPLSGSLRRHGKDVEAGTSRKDGYRQIQIGKNFFLSHRLAWFIHNQEVPDFIDHQNGNRVDNRIEDILMEVANSYLHDLNNAIEQQYIANELNLQKPSILDQYKLNDIKIKAQWVAVRIIAAQQDKAIENIKDIN